MLDFMEHNGVKVFRTFKEGDFAEGRILSFVFSTVDDGDDFGPHAFDVRELPTFKGTGAVVVAGGFGPISTEGDQIKAAIREAIDQGLVS